MNKEIEYKIFKFQKDIPTLADLFYRVTHINIYKLSNLTFLLKHNIEIQFIYYDFTADSL